MAKKKESMYMVLSNIIIDDVEDDDIVYIAESDAGFDSFYPMNFEEECTNFQGYITTSNPEAAHKKLLKALREEFGEDVSIQTQWMRVEPAIIFDD